MRARPATVPSGELAYRAASFEDLSARDVYELLALRAEIFVVEQRCAYLDPDGRDLEAWHVLGRDRDGILGAHARVFPASTSSATSHRIGRVVVHAALRGVGEGRRLMREAIAVCARHDARLAIELAAQAHLQRFYESLGFVRSSEVYDEDGIPHVDMRRDADPGAR
jgi:ElaA protein